MDNGTRVKAKKKVVEPVVKQRLERSPYLERFALDILTYLGEKNPMESLSTMKGLDSRRNNTTEAERLIGIREACAFWLRDLNVPGYGQNGSKGKISFPEISRVLGYSRHTTVCDVIKRYESFVNRVTRESD